MPSRIRSWLLGALCLSVAASPSFGQCLDVGIDVAPGVYEIGDVVPIVLSLACEAGGAGCETCRVELTAQSGCGTVFFNTEFCCLPAGGSISVYGSISLSNQFEPGLYTVCAKPRCEGCASECSTGCCECCPCGDTVIVVTQPCAADLDRSGAVDFTDLMWVLSRWGPCPTACRADIDMNGVVGFDEVTWVLSSWGACESDTP